MHIRRGALTVKQNGIMLVISICAVYVLSTIAKLNFSAGVSFFVNEGIFTKSQSGVISALFYTLYGVGQIALSGIIDRISPVKVLLFGLVSSLLVNVALIFFESFTAVAILWSANGLVLFGIWPSSIVIVTTHLSDRYRRMANVGLTVSMSLAGMLSYLLVTPVLEVTGWRGLFVFNTALMVAVLGFWAYIARQKPEQSTTSEKKTASEKRKMPGILSMVLALIGAISFIQAIMCNGIKSWVPTMIMESYNTSVMWASLLNVIIYLSNMVFAFCLIKLVRNIRNELAIFGMFFVICVPFVVAMLYLGRIPQWIIVTSLVAVTCLTQTMYSINIRVSAKFAAYGFSGGLAGLTNGLASLGIVAANGGFGYLADYFGWGSVTVACLVVTVAAVLICIPASILWHRATNTVTRVISK